MGELSEREARLRNKNRRTANQDYFPAVVGDATGNVYDPNLPGNVLVRIQTSQGLSPQVISVKGPVGQAIKLDPATPVKLGQDQKGRVQIIGLDPDAYVSLNINPTAVTQRLLSPRTSQSNIETLWCLQSSPPSTIVNVKSWSPIINNVYYIFAGGSIDLASKIPGTGLQAWVVVFVKNDYLTLEAFASATVSTTDTIDQRSSIQTCLNQKSGGSTPVWALLLSNAQTTITQNTINNGQDLRDIIGSNDGGGGAQVSRILTSPLGIVLIDMNGYVMTRAV